jgi:alginate O-acetyltransferase complex protein AlgI
MRNFEEPYLAADITEFWRRWHISLSTWLRDYLYIPLGGNRRGRGRTYFNLMATMLLGGLWHGAAWNFVIWGGLHGVYLAVHRMLGGAERKLRTGVRAVAGGLVTFHLVCFAWIFFRAKGLAEAWAYVAGLARGTAAPTPQMLETVVYLGAILGLDLLLRRRGRERMLVLFSPHWAVETGATAALVLAILFIGDNHVVPFIYFQF